LKAADLNLNQNSYVKVRDRHRGNVVYYINEEEGVEYSVDEETNLVGLIRYLPAASDKALKCPDPRNRLNETIEVAQYSNIPLAAERRILDKFAQQIIRYTSINYASAQAYIFVYDDKDGRSRASTMRVERAKTYLVNTHRINPNRISILQAGYRKKVTIKLYLVPPGASPPHLGSLYPKHDASKRPTLA
jgi:hypothetical protein